MVAAGGYIMYRGRVYHFWGGDELSRLEALWDESRASCGYQGEKDYMNWGGAVFSALGENVVELFELVQLGWVEPDSS